MPGSTHDIHPKQRIHYYHLPIQLSGLKAINTTYPQLFFHGPPIIMRLSLIHSHNLPINLGKMWYFNSLNSSASHLVSAVRRIVRPFWGTQISSTCPAPPRSGGWNSGRGSGSAPRVEAVPKKRRRHGGISCSFCYWKTMEKHGEEQRCTDVKRGSI